MRGLHAEDEGLKTSPLFIYRREIAAPLYFQKELKKQNKHKKQKQKQTKKNPPELLLFWGLKERIFTQIFLDI